MLPKKICSIDGQGVITDLHVWNWFSDNMSLRDEPKRGCTSNLDQDAFRELVGCNPHKSTRELALDFNTSQSTIWKR